MMMLCGVSMPIFYWKYFTKDGKCIEDQRKSVCMAELRERGWMILGNPGCYMVYDVEVNAPLTQKDALWFYTQLKTIGWRIPQTPEDILKNGFRLCFADLKRKQGIVMPELGGILTVVRYVHEFPNLVKRFQTMDSLYRPGKLLWEKLSLAHVVGDTGMENSNHLLFPRVLYNDEYGHIGISWGGVLDKFAKSKIVLSRNHTNWHIHDTFQTIRYNKPVYANYKETEAGVKDALAYYA